MPLEWTIQQAPMRFGLAEGIDPHQVPFGTLVTAENVCWDRSGQLRKRFGVTALTTSISGGGSLASIGRLIVRGTELAITTGSKLYSYNSSGWIDRGRHPEIGLDWSTSIDTVTGVASCDTTVLSNGLAVEAWVNGDPAGNAHLGTLFYQIRDTATDTILTAPTQIATSVVTGFRIVSTGTTWVIVYATSAGALRSYTSTGITTLQTDVKHSSYPGAYYNNIDACVIGTDFVVVYPTNAGDIKIRRYSIATTPVLAATGTISTEAVVSISICGAAGEYLYVAWGNSTNLRFASADPSTMTPTAASTLTAFVGESLSMIRNTSTTCLILFSTPLNGGIMRTFEVSNAGAVFNGQYNQFMRPISRPFNITTPLGQRTYCIIATEIFSTSFFGFPIATSETFLVDVTRDSTSSEPYRLVGKIDALVGGVYAWGFVTSANTISSTLTTVAVPYQSQISAERGAIRQGIRYVRCTTGAALPADMWRNIQIGPEAYFAAGVLTGYDSFEALGYGWASGPNIDPPNTVASAAGGTMATGTYLYAVTAERRSNVGILHRSPVSSSYSVAVTGPTGSVTVGVVPARLGHSTSNPGHFPFYRTIVNGSVPQRIAFEPADMTIVDTLLNTSPTTIVDTRSDATVGGGTYALSTRPALYTVGGELEDIQPPSCLTLTLFQSRMWMVAGDGRTVWFSKDPNANPGTAPGFYPTNSIQFDRDVTALCAMDDKLVVFAANTFWCVFGEGPAPNGDGSTYTVGAVQTDVGCTNPRSVVSTPIGVVFQSARGLHLLSRKLEVAWLGRPIKDQLAAYPNITSAVLVAAKNEIRWTANNTGGTAGIVLVYNYVEDQWSTFKYTLGGVYGAPIADACMWNDTYTFATSTGAVYTESTSYLDGSTWIPLTIETAWIPAGGPLAYQSVRNFAVEGTSNTNHDLTISVGFDNSASYAQTRSFAAASAVTTAGPLQAQISIGTRRKCQSIRFKIQDASPTGSPAPPVGTGQGPSFDTIGIEVGLMKGFAAKPAANRG